MSLPCNRIRLGALAVFWGMLPTGADCARARTVTGRVVTSDGEAIQGAVVRIKNTRTLHIRSFISEGDGGYHFAGLNPDIDYELHASYRQRASKTKTVSQFESAEVLRLDLVLEREPGPEH
jgi:hypothetical protein